VVLTGALTQPPQLQNLGTLNVTVGGRLEVPLMATSPDGGLVTLSLRDANNLPTGQLSNGTLTFTPSPTDVGTYHFTLVATSSGLETTQAVTLNVAADPVTTTRVSGVVQNTDQMPLAGILVDVDGSQAVTDAQGRFTVTVALLKTSTLRIMGGMTTGSDYPSIVEKLPLMLEHDVYVGVNNDIARPIYLPKLDYAGGQIVDSFHDAVVTSAMLPGAAVTVTAGSLKDQSGNSFTGVMSITEVPVNLTPAALPGNLHPDLVVTIQPGEMKFTTPAPLTLPNRSGYAPATLMDLWSINPITGQFDNVGTGQVSADGSVINTITGGIINSSWHFFSPLAERGKNPSLDPRNKDNGCDTCQAEGPSGSSNPSGGTGGGANPSGSSDSPSSSKDGGNANQSIAKDKIKDPAKSEDKSLFDLLRGRDPKQHHSASTDSMQNLGYMSPLEVPPQPNTYTELHSGATIETVVLQPYQSIFGSQGIVLRYDSTRADARQIVHFGYQNIQPDSSRRLVAKLTLVQKNFTYQVPGYTGSDYGLKGGENFWSIPNGGGTIDAALQIDMRSLPTGQYDYTLDSGLERFINNTFFGTTATTQGKVIQVNSINSPFGSGWGVAGLQQLVENSDGSVLFVDGDGTQLLFKPSNQVPGTYISPAGDFSTLEKQSNGTFRRTMTNQTKYSFNVSQLLSSIEDTHGNLTQYLYNSNSNISKIIDPVGLETVFSYVSGRVSKITDPAERVTQMECDASGNLSRLIHPDGTIQNWEYDGNHHLTAKIDALNNKDQISYDFAGRTTQTVHADGSTVKINAVQTQGLYRPDETIDPKNSPKAFALGASEASYVDGNGNVVRVLLDQGGQAVTQTDGGGALPSVGRDTHNLITRRNDGHGNITLLTYDDKGNVTSIQDKVSDTNILSSQTLDKLFPSYLPQGGTKPAQIVSADINQDGRVDLISANQNGTVSVLLGDGKTGFISRNDYVVGGVTEGVVVADLNHDGIQDIVTANLGTNAISILFGDGQGGFRTATNYVAGTGNFSLGESGASLKVGDINNDGWVDIIETRHSSVNGGTSTNELITLLSNKDGTFTTQSNTSPIQI
jgi:YD repeat-containing protein